MIYIIISCLFGLRLNNENIDQPQWCGFDYLVPDSRPGSGNSSIFFQFHDKNIDAQNRISPIGDILSHCGTKCLRLIMGAIMGPFYFFGNTDSLPSPQFIKNKICCFAQYKSLVIPKWKLRQLHQLQQISSIVLRQHQQLSQFLSIPVYYE